MTIQDALKQKRMSIYRLAKTSKVPYATVNDICNGKAQLEKCSAETIYRIAHALDITMEELLAYYDRKWYPESLYLLAMLDYISRENDIPLCDEYDDLRRCKLEKPVYPAGLRAVSAASKDKAVLHKAAMTAIPEFKRFNIIENEVRNVI